jgi:thiamine-phosphate pyrophosphorylase
MKRIDWKLCLVADVETAAGKYIISSIKEAIEGGVSLVQLRAKKLETHEFFELSLKVRETTKKKNIPLIINDRVDITLSCNADGVHLGQDDLPVSYARKILGKKKLIGVSVNTEKEAEEAEKRGADYLGVGPIYFTQTKKDIKPPLGVEGLREIRKRVRIPILAIGGISVENAREIVEAGADGIAVVSAILATENIIKATRELAQAISQAGND